MFYDRLLVEWLFEKFSNFKKGELNADRIACLSEAGRKDGSERIKEKISCLGGYGYRSR